MVYVEEGHVKEGNMPSELASTSFDARGVVCERQRYHLYVSAGCPFCSRCTLVLALKGLEHVVTTTTVLPKKSDQGWEFASTDHGEDSTSEGCAKEPLYGFQYLHQVYAKSHPQFTGRLSVPVLFDKVTQKVVSNDSLQIMRLLNDVFQPLVDDPRNTYNAAPEALRPLIDAENAVISKTVNMAVYRVGMATDQDTYETEARAYYHALSALNARLSTQRFLMANTQHPTEPDLLLFATLARHDLIYNPLFKLTLKRLRDYPALLNFTRDIFQLPRVSSTFHPQLIRITYYSSFAHLAPKLVWPKGGETDFTLPHNRGKLCALSLNAHASQNSSATEESGTRTHVGEFVRPKSGHRNWISADPSAEFPAEANRYHLFIANNCPWCHRCALTRAIKGLTGIVSMDVLYYRRDDERGWQFKPEEPGCTEDTAAGGIKFIRDLYEREGSAEKSVPVLYDRKSKRIVSNESAEIIRMFNSAFGEVSQSARESVDLYPEGDREQIDAYNTLVYTTINNGAYKAGFSSAQAVYDRAFDAYFDTIERLNGVLARQTFLCGSAVTEADVRLFPTLFRHDAIYYSRFRLNKGLLRDDYPHVHAWLLRMLALPGVADASSLVHCMKGYYGRTGNNIIPLMEE